jgi:hypothetical protein
VDIVITLLTAGSWIGITLLVFFLRKIARFYERSSDETAQSWLFLFPIVLLPAGALWYLMYSPDFVGEPIGDLLLFIGGAVLITASYILQQAMMGEQ